MRSVKVAVAVAVLSLTVGCGGGDEPEQPAQPPPAEEESSPETPTSESSGSESESASESAGTQVLTGVVGEDGDPDAFVITLVDDSGEAVTSLPAGEYEVQVSDPSAIHNFHLTGPGVEETTDVPEVVDVTWTVTLEAGEYTFVCDPHAQQMVGTFTVT